MRRVEPGAWKAPEPRRRTAGEESAALPIPSGPGVAGAAAAGAPPAGAGAGAAAATAAAPAVGAPVAEADPWNAPAAARSVESAVIAEPGAEPPPATPSVGTARPGDASRIAELEAAIARDQEALKRMISVDSAAGTDTSDDVREIAHRLPVLQRELAQLRARRSPPE
jgi:hypothetical protein